MDKGKTIFNQRDIAEYYNTTQVHYRKMWGLDRHFALHYGLWDDDTKSFGEALKNTNEYLLNKAEIKSTNRVLDAGCGVGGSSFYIHDSVGATVDGITLSELQISTASEQAKKKNVSDKVRFQIMDFTNTSFPDGSFDVIWACESVCHAEDKSAFVKESYRLLKPNGRLIICDFFKKNHAQKDSNNWIKKWGNTWAVSDFATVNDFEDFIKQEGFSQQEFTNLTTKIKKSAVRLYRAYLLGVIPSNIYNVLFPNVSRFAKIHFKCGYYQYKALKENLWEYGVILARK